MITTPSDEIFLKYASGVLDPALRLLVDQHLALHPESRDLLLQWQQLGGAMLAAEHNSAMTAGSLDRALARLGSDTATATPAPASLYPVFSLDDVSWRWAGPGRAIANIDIPGSALKTYALKIAPGKAMLQHTHAAEEWTLIVQGSYRDEGGEYATGSFIEEDDETNHRPIATGDVTCICIAVMAGPLSAPGMTGKVAQWLMR